MSGTDSEDNNAIALISRRDVSLDQANPGANRILSEILGKRLLWRNERHLPNWRTRRSTRCAAPRCFDLIDAMQEEEAELPNHGKRS